MATTTDKPTTKTTPKDEDVPAGTIFHLGVQRTDNGC